ncbi:MAG: hypothetical protein WBH40_16540 [Ignavibacteriaceae bacterium]
MKYKISYVTSSKLSLPTACLPVGRAGRFLVSTKESARPGA